MTKPKILFVYYSLSSFVMNDLKILKKHFDVTPLRWRDKRDLFKIIRGVWSCDLSFSWFAWNHAGVAVFFSRLFRKKSIVIAGGFDVAYEPEINYGIMVSPQILPKLSMKFALKYADAVLAVSESTKSETLKWTTPRRIGVVYNAFNLDKYKPKGEKEDLVITVGNVAESTLLKKGLKVFVESAKYLPHTKFVLIGRHSDSSISILKSISTPNVEFTGFIPFQDLLSYLQRAKVYVQVSAHESFGCSLAEAMLCECVPVVTNRGALPEVVGDTGFYVPYGESRGTAEKIKRALKSDKGKEARERIKNTFPLERREREVARIIEELLRL